MIRREARTSTRLEHQEPTSDEMGMSTTLKAFTWLSRPQHQEPTSDEVGMSTTLKAFTWLSRPQHQEPTSGEVGMNLGSDILRSSSEMRRPDSLRYVIV